MILFSKVKAWIKSKILPPPPHYMSIDQRIEMTISCRDADTIPKVSNAGEIIDWQGEKVQIMHEGTKVIAGGYYGDLTIPIIKKLKGHHEPQEELIFYHVLKYVKPGSLMIELGSFWSYYTNWFLGAKVGGRAICIEPDENNLECGRRNLRLNDREANFIHAAIGKSHQNKIHFKRESDGNKQSIPCLDFNNILEAAQGAYIELIHIDIQGAELPFIESMNNEIIANKIRFIFISTHHHSISGSYHTHRDCLNKLIELGAIILTEHTIGESFSGDGLIVASFNEKDKEIILPEITKNKNELSYFYGN